MSADFWLGCFVGSAFLLVAASLSLALSQRMSAEQRKAVEATTALLREANAWRETNSDSLRRIAEVLETGGRK